MREILTLIALIALAYPAIASTVLSRTTTGPSNLTLQQPKQCAPNGMNIGGQTPYSECCPGLVPMNTSFPGGYTGSCDIPSLRPSHICSPCGNNKCDIATGENICNCPRDCDPAL
jgi:hypothetical protein